VTETVTIPTPRGGLARMSRRVMNLAHMLTQNARRHGDRIGFIWGDKSWTWREIDGHVSALAAGLAARGIAKGDRILVHSKNCDEMFWSMFAAFRLGAVWVPTNFRLMPDEVAYLATASGAKAFLCHGDFPDHATAAANPALEFIWRIGEGGFGEKAVSDVIADHAGARIENAAVDYDDPCWFFFTSGTTGRSKAAASAETARSISRQVHDRSPQMKPMRSPCRRAFWVTRCARFITRCDIRARPPRGVAV